MSILSLLLILLIHTCLKRCVISQIALNCNDTLGLCLGKQYNILCSISLNYTYKLVSIESDKCEKIEIDFNSGTKTYEEDEVDNCGLVTGSISEIPPWKVINVSFMANEYFQGASVKCFGQDSMNGIIQRSCIVSIAEKPDPPVNVSLTSSHPVLITWTGPNTLRGQADQNMEYNVSITSSLGGTKEFIVKDNSMKLPEEATDETITYTVCISSVNCIGMSDPVCAEAMIAPPVVNVQTPMVNSSILNSTSIGLSWIYKAKSDVDIICFDIERNFIIEHHCINERSTVVIVERAVKVHTLRVRARVSGIPGKWSVPECIIFAVPFPLKLDNYDVTTTADSMTTTVNLCLRLQDQSQFVGGCKVSEVNEISISSELKSFSHIVVEGAMEQNVSFTFNRTAMQNGQTLKINIKPVSNVGEGPEQFHYILIEDEGNCALHLCSSNLILVAVTFILQWMIR